MSDQYTGAPTVLQNVGAAINTATGNLPAHVQRLIAALKNVSPKANPQDPNDPTGKGGAAHQSVLDRQIADAGG